eukprot:snap_masked-scaffold_9-processed-gene-6.26-mRNA-1 protein AED:1.00 eAED:1.00 QI:0/0/0/0/1/1/2/0/72
MLFMCSSVQRYFLAFALERKVDSVFASCADNNNIIGKGRIIKLPFTDFYVAEYVVLDAVYAGVKTDNTYTWE